MNKRTAQKRKKARGEAERLRKRRDELDHIEMEEMLAEGEESLDRAEPEEVEKDYVEYDHSMMEIPGPTSWDELDSERQANEQAREVREQTYDVEYLVGNILRDSSLVPTEKADRMMDVADGFAERVNGIMSGEDMQKSIDVLEIEAMLATYERNIHSLQKAADWVEDQAIGMEEFLEKKDLTTKTRKRLQDSDFALPEKRKYPIHDKAHVRNALARAAQMMEQGGQAAADAKAAMPKIRAAAKKFGITLSKSAFLLQKDQNDEWRWVGMPANNLQDRQRDVMSRLGIQKYCAWLDKHADFAPRFIPWHTNEPRTYPVDYWAEYQGALIMSGKLTEGEARALFSIQKETDIGMSLRGWGLRLDKSDSDVITDFWLYEVSDLPVEKAANPFNIFELIEPMTKEVDMELKDYLTKVWGSEEKADEYLKNVAANMAAVKAAGIKSKSVDEEPETLSETPQGEPAPAPVAETDAIQAIAKAVAEQLKMDDLNAFLASLQTNQDKLKEDIGTLRKTREDELAETLTPPAARFIWAQTAKASMSKETEVGEEDELAKEEPGLGEEMWLSRVTHTAPISQKEVANVQ